MLKCFLRICGVLWLQLVDVFRSFSDFSKKKVMFFLSFSGASSLYCSSLLQLQLPPSMMIRNKTNVVFWESDMDMADMADMAMVLL